MWLHESFGQRFPRDLPVSIFPAVEFQLYTVLSDFYQGSGDSASGPHVYRKHFTQRAASQPRQRATCIDFSLFGTLEQAGRLKLSEHIPTTDQMFSLEMHTDLNWCFWPRRMS